MGRTFLQTNSLITDVATYTFTSENLGSAFAGRHILVAITSRKSGVAACTLDSVSINGVSASLSVQQVHQATNTSFAGLALASVPTGTSGDIVITFNAAMVRCLIAVYALTDLLSLTPHDSDSSTATNPTANLDIPANGVAFGTAVRGSSASATWSGLTEDYDFIDPTETAQTMVGASDEFVSPETGRTITCTFGGATQNVGVFASWAFAAVAAGQPSRILVRNANA